MNSWFDIKSLTPGGPEPEDEAGLLKSVGVIQALVGKEVDAGIEASRIVVGGFSQGEFVGGYPRANGELTFALLGVALPSLVGAVIALLTGATSERVRPRLSSLPES